jgi:hypothetical protein
MFGFSFTVRMEVSYALEDTKSGSTVWTKDIWRTKRGPGKHPPGSDGNGGVDAVAMRAGGDWFGRAPQPVSLAPRNEETTPYCSRQGVPASVVKVPLFEYQPLIPIDGPPKNHEKNANSCRS